MEIVNDPFDSVVTPNMKMGSDQISYSDSLSTPQHSRTRNRISNEYETPKDDAQILKNIPKILTRSQKNALPIFTPKWKILSEEEQNTDTIDLEPMELDFDSDEDTDDEAYAIRHYSKEIAERFSWETRLKTKSIYTKEDLKMSVEDFKKSDLFQTYKRKTKGKRLLESQWADHRDTMKDREDDFKRRYTLLKASATPPPKPKPTPKQSSRIRTNPLDVFDKIYSWKITRNYGKHGRTIVMRRVRMTSLNPELFLIKQ